MYLADDQLILSPTDLNGFVECRHLTQLELARLRGELAKPASDDPIASLLSRKGDEFERSYLERLRGRGAEIVEIPEPADSSPQALLEPARLTEQAIRDGAEVIYQATFFDGGFRGHADFLERVDGRASKFGDWAYEVADTKLARSAKPYFLIQLCFYSELLQRVQGGEPPERIHLLLGSGERETFRLAEFSAYFRRIRERFLAAVSNGSPDTYPEPCAHCSICDWLPLCDARRVDDDHLSLVANNTRGHRARLTDAGIATLAELAAAPQDTVVDGLRSEMFHKHRAQAALQVQTRETGEPALEVLTPEANRGLALLPRPDDGDVFFDLEGDPLYADGLEYLWGFVTSEPADPGRFEVWWGRDHAEERATFERFVDYVVERRRRYPGMHVYHYAAYEITALKRLAGAHGSREAELDQLLREHVFVDLYRVVRQGLQIGMPSYSLKKVEAFYMDQRETQVTDGNQSMVEFERWLDEGGLGGGDQKILDAIAAYNRDDCLSTLRLRNWLLEQRAACEAEHGQIEWYDPDATELSEKRREQSAEVAALIAGLVPDPAFDPEAPPAKGLDPADHADQVRRWLLAQLLEYHLREARPVWWARYDRMGCEVEVLRSDAECVAGLSVDPKRPPEPAKRSIDHHLRFEPQETKMRAGRLVEDAETCERAGTVVAIDAEEGTLTLRRGPTLADVPMPESLMPGGPIGTDEQQAALRRFAADVTARGLDDRGSYAACRDLLSGEAPRVRGVEPGTPLYERSPTIEGLRHLVSEMDDTCLVVQGPPGSGKTYTGARLVTHLIREGKRIGVTSTSHKVIHNLLEAIEKAAADEGLEFRGLKKCSGNNRESIFESDHIESVDDNSALTDPGIDLPAGTAWHFSREETDGTLDYLFIDEAGQVSLADALALGTAARNVVLLGDPQQLPQVSQGAHPKGSSVSALEHLLAGDQTIPPQRGVFLDRTWRLHPRITEFCSELMYDGRLESVEGLERQRIVGAAENAAELEGSGIRWVPVEHAGRSQSSVEEADRIAELVHGLENARYVDAEGAEHPLRPEDIMVVTPFNAQLKCLEARLPAGIRCGTVDKFQGQEAQVVFFSLATSSGEEVPRSLEFLLSRNRLNVAVSRARCLAAVIANPQLLDIDCTTTEQMRLINAMCRVAEPR
jgi:uncharacterized protein